LFSLYLYFPFSLLDYIEANPRLHVTSSINISVPLKVIELVKKHDYSPVPVAHAYNPCYLGRLRLGNLFQASPQKKKKKFVRPHLKRKKLDMVMCTYHSSYSGKGKIGGSWSRPAWAKGKTLAPK
jgi:hypothetical protein